MSLLVWVGCDLVNPWLRLGWVRCFVPTTCAKNEGSSSIRRPGVHDAGCMRSILTSPAGAVTKYCDEYVCLCVCLSVCICVSLSARISPEPHARSLPLFLCSLPVSVARSSSGMLTIGRIAYRRQGGDGSAQRRRSVNYDCLVSAVLWGLCLKSGMHPGRNT